MRGKHFVMTKIQKKVYQGEGKKRQTFNTEKRKNNIGDRIDSWSPKKTKTWSVDM